MSNWTNDAILDALRGVVEPELGKDVVSLDLVEVEGAAGDHGEGLTLTVKSSNPAMHARKRMQEAVEFALERAFGKPVACDVKVIPTASKRNARSRPAKVLPGVEHVIAVASGKGGVGKSTVSSNLAVALAQLGYKVGLVDADIHGPSVPTMFDVAGEKPQPVEVEGKTKIEPIEQYGVKVLSIGFFADPDQAIVWRGPMASRALNQLFTDADWGKLDFMIVDLPPGTGDIHLVLGAADSALWRRHREHAAGRGAWPTRGKGVGMFRLDELKVPVLGMVRTWPTSCRPTCRRRSTTFLAATG